MLSLLREHTAELHRRAERAVDLPTRCGDLESYGRLLELLLGIHSRLESQLSSWDWAAVGIDFPARQKAHLLRTDLLALGWTAEEVRAVPTGEDRQAPGTLAGAFGALYVVEGATLGGRIIARQVYATLGVEPSSGGAFHACYGERSGEMWRSFCQALEHYCGGDEQRTEEALEAAAATFETFERQLGKELAPPARPSTCQEASR